jgi:hypothetical protein
MDFRRPLKQIRLAMYIIAGLLVLLWGTVLAIASVPRYSAGMLDSYVEKVISNGLADVGKVEKTGRNDGKHIDRYARTVGMPLQSAYCYAAIYTWSNDAATSQALKNPLPRTGSTQTAFTVASKTFVASKNTSARRGDILIWRIPRKWLGHAALITRVRPDGIVETIEANTSRTGSGDQRDGGGVWTKRRFINRGLGRMIVRGLIGIGA